MTNVLVLGTVGREKVESLGRVSPIVFGGTAFYATEALLRAGVAEPLLVSALGYDLTVAELIKEFSRGVLSEGLQRIEHLPSFYWEARYEGSLEASTTVVLENRLIDEFTPPWAELRNQFPGVQYCYLAAFDPGVQLSCTDHFQDAFIVSETLEYWIGRDREGVLEIASRSDGLVLTEYEFQSLWRRDVLPYLSHGEVAPLLHELDLEFLIVTFADRGSQVFEVSETFFVPAIECVALDSTGAGNAYSGGLTGHLALGGSYDRSRLVDAVALATTLGGIQVQDFGNSAFQRYSSAQIARLQREVKESIMWRQASDAGVH